MSSNNTGFSVSLFYSYCHVDTEHRAAMEKSLAFLKNDNLLSDWSDQKITPGKKIKKAVRKKMHEADILVFLLSQSFIASDACMDEWQ